jgi:AGCS family alanine or glycine:cation symporter
MPERTKMIAGFILATIVGFVIIGGVKSIAKWCTALVPLLAAFYTLGCAYILFINREHLGNAISLIISEAFSLKAIGGGTAGTVLMAAARYGIARGLFSNESGMGSAPIVAAAAQTRNPVRQALVSSTGTFWDTVVICAITGLVIVSSIIASPEIDQSDGGMLTKKAFGLIPYVGTPILTFGIITFAFSTILGWSYYGEKAVEYLVGKRGIIFYRIVYILLVYAGATMSLALVWGLSDIMNALMAIPNLLSLLLLSNIIAKDTQYYLWGKRLEEDAGN